MPRYSDAIFRVAGLEEAKKIILTPTEDLGMEHRWAAETPYLRDQMLLFFAPDVLDFGCGVGRLAKTWLGQRPGGRVLGVDLSADMRRLALEYVADERFAACSPERSTSS